MINQAKPSALWERLHGLHVGLGSWNQKWPNDVKNLCQS
jgi:hypothetical protein